MESDKAEPEPEKTPEEPTPMSTDNVDKPETDGVSGSSNPTEAVNKDFETWTLLEDGNKSGRTPSPPAPTPVQPPPTQLIYPPTGKLIHCIVSCYVLSRFA